MKQSIIDNPTAAAAIRAIEEAKPNQGIMVQRFWRWLTEQLDTIAPDYSDETVPRDETLVQSIFEAPPLFSAFAQVAEVAASVNSDAIDELGGRIRSRAKPL